MDRFEEAKAKIKDAVDLVSLVERYLPLKRTGRNLVGLCPFHAEKTPSFHVNPATQHYKCFGCGKAGDVFSFLMEREGLDFRSAFEALAERAGIPVAGVLKGTQGPDGRSMRTAVAQTLSAASAHFQACLQSAAGDGARAYLDARGLLVAAEQFGLGFHPSGGELLRFARGRKLALELLQSAGLLGRDGVREPYAGRLMFPITDEVGRVVAFGGRVLAAGQEPKYLNSPESPHFNKRRLLFGLRQAKEAGARKLIVVEGYTDVIACHLAGFTGAVATLGTSLTAEHARLLLRWATEGVVLLFDGDRAGRQAAERALRELADVDLPLHIAFLPEGVDPADLLGLQNGTAAEQGRDRLAAVLASADEPTVAWMKLLRQRFDLHDPVGASRAAQECAGLLSLVGNVVRREAMLRKFAAWFGGDEAVLRRLIKPRGRTEEGVPPHERKDQPPGVHGAAPRVRGQRPGTAGRKPWRPGDRRAAETRPPTPLDDTDVGRALGLGAGAGRASDPVEAETAPARAPAPEGVAPGVDRALFEAEVDLLACVLARSDLHGRLASLEFQHAATADVLTALCACARDAAVPMERLAQNAFTRIAAASPAAASALAAAVDRAHHIREPEQAFAATDERRRGHLARGAARRLRVELAQARVAGDGAKVEQLTRLFYAHFRQSQT